MTLLITESDVIKCSALKDYVDAAEDGYRQMGRGLAETLPRREVRIRGKDLPHADPRMTKVSDGLALLEESGIVVVSIGYSFPGKKDPPRRFLKYLVSADNGDVLAVVDSFRVGANRTGAGGALGAKLLSRRDSRSAGMVGAGNQARIQLRFLREVREITRAYVFSRTPSKAERFADEMGKELSIDITPIAQIPEMRGKVDIMVTATQSFTPIVKAEDLSPGIHVNIIGADDPPKIELEGDALRKADKLVIAAEDCLSAGQLAIPMAEGKITREHIYATMGEVAARRKPGREREDEITIFHSPGLNLEDGAACYMVYNKAKQQGLGRVIPDPFDLKPSA